MSAPPPAPGSGFCRIRRLGPAAVPLAAAAVTLALLLAWVGGGRAGTPAEITVTSGTVYLPVLPDRPVTAVFLTVANTGGSADELLAADAGAAGRAMFSDRVLGPGSGRMEMTGSIVVPAHSTLRMSPFTPNIMLTLDRPLALGETIALELDFRHSGRVRTTATVISPRDAGRPSPSP